ncbi:DUF4261 domain-containing protein [Laceyella putida]|uniref:DUF4261 domain-containing protein n=1 Tax=Laceyella putida TaxID=110101 RepID=A0ABW2RMC1_9BACL
MTTIIGIPGCWPDRSAMIGEFVKQNLIMAGFLLQEVETGIHLEINVVPHDPSLRDAFHYASYGNMTEDELAQIDRHTHILYLICESGQLDDLKALMRIGAKILDAGGMTVKVESAGVAHRKETWLEMSRDLDEVALYGAFVAKLKGEAGIYTCGMQQFGFKDVLIKDEELPPDEAVYLADQFLLYLLIEKAQVEAGQTFALAPEAPLYRIGEVPCDQYHPEDLFHNPAGYWVLERVL